MDVMAGYVPLKSARSRRSSRRWHVQMILACVCFLVGVGSALLCNTGGLSVISAAVHATSHPGMGATVQIPANSKQAMITESAPFGQQERERALLHTEIAHVPDGGIPAINGQLILISEAQQWMWVYLDRQLVFQTPVTTGMPIIPTPTGIFHILYKETNVTFTSAYPPGSPLYYTPEHINYALFFHEVGFYIHDAPWRQVFGPGSNLPHPTDGLPETGSHGCVNISTEAAAWLYGWAAIGATIDIVVA